ncbi:uncharacterized protein LOC113848975 [Abrus precatorius]|uniref:Uncharacterized protein LOC113848975 n=1 Tax=Abrus precatorius TaxID=3816 RepID=A0A8B8JSG4_ABRPR|nr:uncharacterized protein LOC113848975 [Abrus precatorius]
MPRPGPRPYECVRRAWHSERHQPMRGSIIQQIFRVSTEAHSPATKTNKEWQEKLPVVVLKVEEIIYSKANSEAEYLNPDTLWDRLSDAIETIIRRDDTSETGELLPPCVEAALNLGCKPLRTSRSDRHNNPRTYLTSRNQQHPHSVSPKTVVSNPLNFLPVPDSNPHIHQNDYTFAAVRHHQHLPVETNTSLNLGSVYPLYYGFEAGKPQLRTSNQGNTCSDTIFVGRPVVGPALEPSRMGLLENFSCRRIRHFPNRIVKESAVEEAGDRECDLSLRLGMCLRSNETSSACELEDVGLRGSQEGIKFSSRSSQRKNEGYSFYPKGTGYDAIYSTEWNIEGDDWNSVGSFQKCKASLGR